MRTETCRSANERACVVEHHHRRRRRCRGVFLLSCSASFNRPFLHSFFPSFYAARDDSSIWLSLPLLLLRSLPSLAFRLTEPANLRSTCPPRNASRRTFKFHRDPLVRATLLNPRSFSISFLEMGSSNSQASDSNPQSLGSNILQLCLR